MLERFRYHHMRLVGCRNPTLDKVEFGDIGKLAIRGREQQLIDRIGGVGSINCANAIRGVSAFNLNGRLYWDASNKVFGNIAPFTGYY
jgi:hypothetical protein